MNKVELDKFHTALKNDSVRILKEVVVNDYLRISINADDNSPHKDFIKRRYQQAKALLDAGLVDKIPNDQVETLGYYRELGFTKEQFFNEFLFIKPNSITFALVVLNEIHEKKVEELHRSAREDKIELARQMFENMLANTGVNLEDLED